MVSPVGYNTFQTGNNLWDHLNRLNPKVMLFIDDLGAAAKFANEHPGSISMYRSFNPAETDFAHQSGLMLSYLKSVAPGVPSNVWINVGCEPGLDGDYVKNLKTLVAESVKCIDWAVANGKKVALPHGAWYGLNPEHYQYLVPLVNKINQYPDNAILTSDEYFGGHSFSGVLDTRGGEAWHVDPANWVASNQNFYYHMGRITDFFQWLKDNGIKLPRWIATEAGSDHLDDIATWLNTLIKTPGYSSIRGWKSLTSQWSAWYGHLGWSPERAYVEMLKAVWEQVYSKWPNVIGLCLYVWGNNNDQQWLQFNLDGAGEFQSLLEKVVWQGTIVTPVPVPKPSNAGTPTNVGSLVTPTYINLRNAPSTAATVISQVKNGTSIQRFSGGEKKAFKDEKGAVNDWSWVETLDASGNVVLGGWMALVSTSWSAQILTPKPPPVPVTYLDPIVSLPASLVDQYNNVDGPNGCSAALLAMFVRWVPQKEEDADLDANEASKAMGRAYGANGTISMIVNTALSKYLIDLNAQVNVTPDKIQAELDAGRVVGILYARGAIDGELALYLFGGSHFALISGYGKTSTDERYFLILDPLQKDHTAPPVNARESQLLTALKNEGSGNTPNQAIFVDPSMKRYDTVPDPVPTPDPFTQEQINWLNAHYVSK